MRTRCKRRAAFFSVFRNGMFCGTLICVTSTELAGIRGVVHDALQLLRTQYKRYHGQISRKLHEATRTNLLVLNVVKCHAALCIERKVAVSSGYLAGAGSFGLEVEPGLNPTAAHAPNPEPVHAPPRTNLDLLGDAGAAFRRLKGGRMRSRSRSNPCG